VPPFSANQMLRSDEQFPRNYFHESRNLDLLRSAAVLFVYVGHLISFLSLNKSGFFALLARAGVLIFFVHTSLVLMLSMERMKTSGLTLYRTFLIRRAFRIYPLSICCVLCVIASRIPFMPLEAYKWPGWGTVAANLLLVQNVTGHKSVIGPLWSLPWEVQMYLVLPALFLSWRSSPWMTVITGYFVTIAAVGLGVLTGSRATQLLLFFPCFLGGMLALTLVRSNVRPKLPAYLWPLAILLVCSVFSILNHSAWSRRAIYPEWMLCTALGLFIPMFEEIRIQRIVGKVGAQVAKYSYGIYLAHVPVLWFSLVILKNEALAIRLGVLIVLTFSIPVLLYYLIEHPLIRFGKRLSRSSEARRNVVVLPSPALAVSHPEA
jgi:peptidoglycan/LPS O-acetylase OafA/YrhL